MSTYILKRLLLMIPMTFGITFISFLVMQLAPGKPGGAKSGDQRADRMTPQQYEVMERAFHLNQPMWKRYFYWLGILQDVPTDPQKLEALKLDRLDELLHEWEEQRKEVLMHVEARRAEELEGEIAAGAKIDPKRLFVDESQLELPPKPTLENVTIPVTGVLVGDFGPSMETHSVKVWTLLKDAIPVTLLFNLLTFALMYAVAIPMGIYSATHQNSVTDRVSTVGLFVLYSLPHFWVAVLLIKMMVSLVPKEWRLPIQGIKPDNADDLTFAAWIFACARHMVLPVIVMTYASFALLSRYMRAGMINEIRSDYVRTARSKGLPEYKVVYKHALRNSLIPIITQIGNVLPALIGGSVIIETIFGIPGMGWLGYKALLARDYTVLMADLTLVAILVMFGFIVSDILYKVADPRITFEGGPK